MLVLTWTLTLTLTLKKFKEDWLTNYMVHCIVCVCVCVCVCALHE